MTTQNYAALMNKLDATLWWRLQFQKRKTIYTRTVGHVRSYALEECEENSASASLCARSCTHKYSQKLSFLFLSPVCFLVRHGLVRAAEREGGSQPEQSGGKGRFLLQVISLPLLSRQLWYTFSHAGGWYNGAGLLPAPTSGKQVCPVCVSHKSEPGLHPASVRGESSSSDHHNT